MSEKNESVNEEVKAETKPAPEKKTRAPRATTAKKSEPAAKPAADTVPAPQNIKDFEDGELWVRNNTNYNVLFDLGQGDLLRLGKSGSVDAIAPLPAKVARHPKFLSYWRRGNVSVALDKDVQEELSAQDQAKIDEQTNRKQETFNSIHDARPMSIPAPIPFEIEQPPR